MSNFTNIVLALAVDDHHAIPIPSDAVTAPSGRKWYRHSSGMGSVMCYTDGNGKARQLLVLDEAYRIKITDYWSSSSTDTSRTNYQSISNNSWSANQTTESIYSNLGSLYPVSETAKGNTDISIDEEHSAYVIIGTTRAITVDGVGCDVPTLDQLIMIYADRDTVNSLNGVSTSHILNSEYSWSSTEYDIDNEWYVSYDGYISNFGKGNPDSDGLCCIPVLELN